jgi:hypothetical protein
MQNTNPRILALLATLAVAVLPAGGAAQGAQQEGPAQQPAAERGASPDPARRGLRRITGTVERSTGNRIDLEIEDGKTQKVALNRDTERLVEITKGARVAIEYRRKIGGFVIAERVLSAAEPEAAPAATGTAPGVPRSTVTGSVVSWNDATLVLKTEAGDLTLYLSPATEYQVQSLAPGLAVAVEYQQSRDQTKLALRVRAAGEDAGASEPEKQPMPSQRRDG